MRLFCFLLCFAAVAQPLPFEKTLDRYTIGPPEFSPSGDRIVFAVSEPVKATIRASHLWMYKPASKELRQLTHSGKSETSPRWSRDGSQLAFTSTRDEGNQIYLLPMSPGGGEARPLTKGKAGVQSYAWSPEGHRIAYLASHPKPDEKEQKEKDKDDARLVDHDSEPPQLWVVNANDGKTSQGVPLGNWTVRQFVWRADGNGFLALATMRPHSDRWEDSLVSIGVDGTLREIAKLKGPASNLELAPDGRHLAYSCARVDGPDAHDLCVMDPETGATKNLSRQQVDRAVMGHKWQSATDLLVMFQDGFLNAPMRVGLNGNVQPAATKGSFSAYTKHPSTGAVAYIRSSSAQSPELWYANERVTNFHKGWTAPAALETFRYKSFDGTTIEGGLLRPSGGIAGSTLPLAVLVHGGPTGRWQDQFEPWGQLLASRGIAVFYPNPRGSTGYGFDFVAANRADWGFGDFKDIMAGVDDLVQRKVADPERMGIGGWSYGGYMAMWAVTQTNRFKCAVAGAGMSDLASEFGTEGSSAYDEWFFGTPYDNLDKFQRSSPITYVKNAKTPTLILQGENDLTDPIGQSQQFYRALKLLGVPSDFVVYPREGHGIREEKHMLDLYRRTVEWFEKYLNASATPNPKQIPTAR